MMPWLRTASALLYAERWAAALRSTPPDWAARRDAKIHELAQHTGRHTRFYSRLWAQAGIDPQTIRGAADLARLPVVERLRWRAAGPADILSTRPAVRLWHNTGGTTGQPLRLPYTFSDDSRMTAGMLAVWRANGIGWPDLVTYPPPRLPRNAPRVRRVGRLLYLHASLSAAEQQLLLDAAQYPYVRCLPWPLWRAVVASRRQNHPLPPVKAIFTAGEVLTGSVRRTLAAALSTRVINHFGTTDLGHVAAECPAGRLHVFYLTTHIELLAAEGRPVEPGEAGEIVVTSFVTHGRPAVRVRAGDWAMWGQGPCPCGSPVPWFAASLGRDNDCVRLPSGRLVRWPEVENALESLGGDLWGCQVEQTAQDQVLVRLSLANPARAEALDRHRLDSLFVGAEVTIEATDDFKVEKNGKTRPMLGPNN